MREVLSGRGLREKTQTPFIPWRIPTGVPMRVGFGICKDCGDAGRLKYGARRSRVMRSGSNMGPGGQGEYPAVIEPWWLSLSVPSPFSAKSRC